MEQFRRIKEMNKKSNAKSVEVFLMRGSEIFGLYMVTLVNCVLPSVLFY